MESVNQFKPPLLWRYESSPEAGPSQPCPKSDEKKETENVETMICLPDTQTLKPLWVSLQDATAELMKGVKYVEGKEKIDERFINIHCPEATAIRIGEKYLHANRIWNGALIASQAPTQNELGLFWRAIWNFSPLIIDLTTQVDRHRKGVIPYHFNEKGKEIEIEGLRILCIESEKPLYTYKIIDVESQEEQTIKRYHYSEWLDCRRITVQELYDLILEIKSSARSEYPLWIHCRAGMGRTGTLATALILLEEIRSGRIEEETLADGLSHLILTLRPQRGEVFVQTREQFELLYEFALFIFQLKKEAAYTEQNERRPAAATLIE